MDLDECDRLMKGRDLGFYSHPADRERTLMALADEVPGLVAEVRRLAPLLETMTRAVQKDDELIEDLKAESKKNYDLYCDTIFQRDRAREEVERLKGSIASAANGSSLWAKQVEDMKLQNDVLRKMLDSANLQVGVAQSLLNDLFGRFSGMTLHDSGCPEDDTCSCAEVKRWNEAMKGFTVNRDGEKCQQEREDGSACEGFIPCPRHFREQNMRDYLEKRLDDSDQNRECAACPTCPKCGKRDWVRRCISCFPLCG